MTGPSGRARRVLRRASTRALDLVRARPGARVVQLTSDAFRGGNHLYLWQWAFLRGQAGHRALVRREQSMTPWTAEFPLLESLTIDAAKVSVLDARELAVRSAYGVDATREDNENFCRALVVSSDSFQARLERTATFLGPETCVLNVRRGDYYSRPEFTTRFGLDIRHHAREALDLVRAAGRATEDILVVSDDPIWCANELTDIADRPLRVVPERTGMFDDLAVLASARTLILANSTFSYWGSHLAAQRDPEHLAIAPSHHEILETGERVSPHFDPRWQRTSYRPYVT